MTTPHFFQISNINQARAAAGKRYLEFLRIPAVSAGLYTLAKGADGSRKSPHNEDELYYVIRGRPNAHRL